MVPQSPQFSYQSCGLRFDARHQRTLALMASACVRIDRIAQQVHRARSVGLARLGLCFGHAAVGMTRNSRRAVGIRVASIFGHHRSAKATSAQRGNLTRFRRRTLLFRRRFRCRCRSPAVCSIGCWGRCRVSGPGGRKRGVLRAPGDEHSYKRASKQGTTHAIERNEQNGHRQRAPPCA